MNLDNDCNFKVTRSSSHDMEYSVNQNASNQFEYVGRSTSRRSKRTTSFAQEQIAKTYNVAHRDDADDAIADFLMPNGISFNATYSPHYKEMV